MTGLGAGLLEVKDRHVSILQSDSDHVWVSRVDVEADDPVGGPTLVLWVRRVLQGVDTNHAGLCVVLEVIWEENINTKDKKNLD